ncbi:hypothetical protein Tco_0620529 [Tanacetum coccineum]
MLLRWILTTVADSRFPEGSSMLLTFDVQVLRMKTNLLDTRSAVNMYTRQDSSRLDVAAKFLFQSSWYIVPTGRVVVPTGRYVVPTGKIIIIVSPGRLNLVPTGRTIVSSVSANAVNRSIRTELPRPGSGTCMASGRISFEELRVVMSDKGFKEVRESKSIKVNLEEHSSKEVVAGVQQSKVTRVLSYLSTVVGDHTFTGLGDGDNVRVSTMAGRSSKNPNNPYLSSTINPSVGSLVARAGEPLSDDVEACVWSADPYGNNCESGEAVLNIGVDTYVRASNSDLKDVASYDCITSMNGDVITKLFGISLFTPKDIDFFTSDLKSGKYQVWSELTREKHQEVMNTIWSIWNKLVVETPIETNAIPCLVFSEDGLSIIASQIGNPIILDSYTSSICIESQGRSSFARCLIEIDSEDVLKESLTMGVPLTEGTRYTIETVLSPTTIVTSNIITPAVEKTNDGFQTAGKKKKKKGKSKSTNDGQFVGPSVKQNFWYKPKVTTSAPKKGATNVGNASKSSSMLKTSTSSEKG